MTLIESIILGLVQGLAEFLPISSSGHLAILEETLNIQNAGIVYDVMLHIGTLLAVVVAFFPDIKKLVIETIGIICCVAINIGRFFSNLGRPRNNKKDYLPIVNSSYRRFVLLIIVSTIPTAIIGVLLKNVVKAAAGSLLVVGICLIISGILLFVADRIVTGKKRVNKVKYSEAGFIGIIQGFATMPGISRSGATITAGLLCGFDRTFAVKYSFIMSIPAILGAMILEIKDFASMSVSSNELLYYFVGMIVAAVVGFIAIKVVLNIVKKKKYKYFAYYCLLIGLVAIIWYIV